MRSNHFTARFQHDECTAAFVIRSPDIKKILTLSFQTDPVTDLP